MHLKFNEPLSLMLVVFLACRVGVFRGARILAFPANACSTENNIPFPNLAAGLSDNYSICKKYWESSMTRINVRLRVVKVRFTQSDFRILRALHNFSEGKKKRKKVTRGSRFYTITSLWVVFSLTTPYFKTVAWLVTYHVNKTMEKYCCSWLSRHLKGGTEYELP